MMGGEYVLGFNPLRPLRILARNDSTTGEVHLAVFAVRAAAVKSDAVVVIHLVVHPLLGRAESARGMR